MRTERGITINLASERAGEPKGRIWIALVIVIFAVLFILGFFWWRMGSLSKIGEVGIFGQKKIETQEGITTGGILTEDELESTEKTAIDSQYLRGATIGTGEGDIPILIEDGKIDIRMLPLELVDGRIVRLNANGKIDANLIPSDMVGAGLSENTKDLIENLVSDLTEDDLMFHNQNTDTGTDSNKFNIGNDSGLSHNFSITVSNDDDKPALRYNGDDEVWEYSNDGVSFVDFSSGGEGDSLALSGGTMTGNITFNSTQTFGNTTATELGYLSGLTFSAGSILYGSDSDSLTALTGVLGDDAQYLRFNWNGGVPTLSWETVSGGGSFNNFILSGDSGTNQTIDDGNTLEIAGGTNIATVAGVTDTMTINLDSILTGVTWNGNAIDVSSYTNLSGDTEIVLTGDALSIASTIARDSELHSAITMSGSYDYITLSGQDIVRGQVNLTTDVTGILPVANGGSGINGSTASNGQLLIGNGTGYSLANLASSGGSIIITNGAGTINLESSLGTSIDISSETNLIGDTEIVLTGDALSIASTIARDSELHSAVTMSGAYDYITLSGQDIVRGQVDLTADVTGILPIANGGSGTSTAFTQGSLVFAGASGVYAQDNASLFWDDTNNELGIGTATPSAKLDVAGDTIISGTSRYLNFGTTSGTTGYGLRDNAGYMEYKNSGGGWSGLSGVTGSNRYVQFNDEGYMGSDADFYWVKSTNTLSLGANAGVITHDVYYTDGDLVLQPPPPTCSTDMTTGKTHFVVGTLGYTGHTDPNLIADDNTGTSIQRFSTVGVDLGVGNENIVDRVGIFLPAAYLVSYLQAGTLQGSNNSTNGTDGTWTSLTSLSGLAGESVWDYIDFSNTTSYRWYRISGLQNSTNVVLQEWELLNINNCSGGSTHNIGVAVTAPTARLHLAAGTATAGTAPLKFTAGTDLTTPEAGAIEFDGTNLHYTDSTPTRHTIATTSNLHNAVTLAGSYDYLTLSTQQITLNQIDLTTDVSGILPVANGGSGTSTAFTQGSVVFAGASGVYAQDNASLFWDDTNNRLGVGTAVPERKMHISYSDATADGDNAALVIENSSAVSSANAAIKIKTSNDSTIGGVQFSDNTDGYTAHKTFGYDHGNDRFGFWPSEGGSPLMVLTLAGNLGIGASALTPTHLIELDSDTYGTVSGWTDASDRNKKENFTQLENVLMNPVKIGTWTGSGLTIDAVEYDDTEKVSLDSNEILNRISILPITQWNFINDGDYNEMGDWEIKHIGPTAQDFYKMFGLGPSDTRIKATDMAGIALIGIKGVIEMMNEKSSDIENLLLQTDQNADTLSGLQKSVDEQLRIVSREMVNSNMASQTQDSRLTSLEGQISSQQFIVETLEGQISEIEDLKQQYQVLIDFMLAVNGSDFVKRDKFGNVELEGNLKAEVVEGGVIAITIDDKNAPTLGRAKICQIIPKDEDTNSLDDCSGNPIPKDFNGDGTDDKTGEPMPIDSDHDWIGDDTEKGIVNSGEFTFIETKAASEESEIFVTSRSEFGGALFISDIENGVGFKVQSNETLTAEVEFSWWIVGKK